MRGGRRWRWRGIRVRVSIQRDVGRRRRRLGQVAQAAERVEVGECARVSDVGGR